MISKVIICSLVLIFVGNVVLAGENLGEISREQAEGVAAYLSSMDVTARERLASRLYYLDPRTNRAESKKTLLNELMKQGRVRKDDLYRTGPRTISTESGL